MFEFEIRIDGLDRQELTTSGAFSQVALIGKALKQHYAMSMEDFTLLIAFQLNIVPPKPKVVKEVMWSLLICFWFKGNSDDASIDNMAAYGRFFKQGFHQGSFSRFLGNMDFFSQLMGVILSMEHAIASHLQCFWLEKYYMFDVIHDFFNSLLVPWKIWNK